MFKKILALSHIDNLEKNVKNTILNLENQFFSIFKIQIENIINEEDRIEMPYPVFECGRGAGCFYLGMSFPLRKFCCCMMLPLMAYTV